METNKIESISKIPQLERVRIAHRIAAHPDWHQLGLCFESRYKWKRSKQELAARLHANATPVEMCERLLEDLAEQGFSTAELIAALQNIGLRVQAKYIKEMNNVSSKEIEDASQFLLTHSPIKEGPELNRHVNLLILTSPGFRALIENKLELLKFFLHARLESKALWIFNGEIKWYALIMEYGENKATVVREYAQYASEVLCIGDSKTTTFRGVRMIAEIQREPPFKMSFTGEVGHVITAHDIDAHLLAALKYIETELSCSGQLDLPVGCVIQSASSVNDYFASRALPMTVELSRSIPYGNIVPYLMKTSANHCQIQTYIEEWIGNARSFVQKRLYIAFRFDLRTITVEDATQMVPQQVPCATTTVGANSSVVVFVETPLYYAWELSLTAHQLFESFKRKDVILRQISHLTIEEVDKAIERKDNEPYVMELKDFKRRMEQYGRRVYDYPFKFTSSDIIVMTDSIVCYTINNDNVEEFIQALEINDTITTSLSIQHCLGASVNELAAALDQIGMKVTAKPAN